MMVYGKEAAATFLTDWCTSKHHLVLVTSKDAYALCGAEAWLTPFLASCRVTHLFVNGANPQAAQVEELSTLIKAPVNGYIAVGGGTVIDTTKLLRGLNPIPFLAIPTTAGTGAEATRFAVFYKDGTKHSADNVGYLPTDQILIPEFCDSAPAYQKASCAFDAYAQAVESLWAKGATEESKGYAFKALDCMKQGEQLLGAYWAGRAIDISRTTAAHAFSYYMTSAYGIPHGHAVYMMFPYICKANGHPEYIKEIPELQTLKSFINEKGLNWSAFIDDLFLNVNAQRLSNNPCEVTKEHFNG